MKYHSRSPEEWKKIDSEKRKSDRVPELRRRSWMYFFVNVVMVGAVMIMIGVFKMKSKSPISVYIRINDEYRVGESVLAQIRLVNSRSNPMKLSIVDFSMRVTDESGKTVHTEELHPSIPVEIPPYDYVLLFKDSFPVSSPGKYTITVEINSSAGKYEATKSFVVEYSISLTFSGYNPYYLLGERPSYDVVVSNKGLKSRDVVISPGEVYIKTGNAVLDERQFPGFNGNVPSNSSQLVFRYQPPVTFSKKGLYIVGLRAAINGNPEKVELPFMVIDTKDVNMKDVDILFDYYEVSNGIKVKVFLTNGSNGDRFFEVKSAVLMVYSDSSLNELTTKKVRVWIPPNGKIELMGKVFNIGGLKGLRAIVEGAGKTLTKEIGGGW